MTKFSYDSFTPPQSKNSRSFWWNQWTLSIGMKTKETFYTELTLLLQAKIPLKQALLFMQDAQRNNQRKAFYKQLLYSLNQGEHLYQALEKQKGFGPYEWNIIKIGEETGALTTVVSSLSVYFKEKIKFRRSLGSAMVYPTLLLLTATFVVIFMLTTIVPLFEQLFSQQKLSLPRATQAIIFLSNSIKNYGLIGCLGCVSLFLLGRWAYQHAPIKTRVQNFSLRIPFLNGIIRNNYAFLFSQTTHLLLKAKVPLAQSLSLMEILFSFNPLQKALASTTLAIKDGERFGDALKREGFFDRRLHAFIEIGEATHQLEEIFSEMVHYYNTKIEQQTKRLTSLLEPFIIVVVGLFIGAILIAMYLPMFQLSTVLG